MGEIETAIRERNPSIEVCDNGVCATYTTGDAAYEAWVARTVAEHEAAQAVQEELDAQAQLRETIIAYLQTLSDNETQLVNGLAVLKGASPPSTVAQLRSYVTAMAEMTLDHNRGIDRLIRYLVRTGVIG